MKMLILKCPDCRSAFSVDQEVVGEDEVVVCPTCEAEVDVEEDAAEVR